MAESPEARSDVQLETSILAGAVPLESILYTEELCRRPSRPPDHEKENRALVKLVSALERFAFEVNRGFPRGWICDSPCSEVDHGGGSGSPCQFNNRTRSGAFLPSLRRAAAAVSCGDSVRSFNDAFLSMVQYDREGWGSYDDGDVGERLPFQ